MCLSNIVHKSRSAAVAVAATVVAIRALQVLQIETSRLAAIIAVIVTVSVCVCVCLMIAQLMSTAGKTPSGDSLRSADTGQQARAPTQHRQESS